MALHLLGRQALETPVPVALREIRCRGLLLRSDLVTLEVPGAEPCPSFLAKATPSARASFLAGLADDIRRLHDAGISLGRPRLRDILARHDVPPHRPVFLDLGRVRRRGWLSWGARIEDLGDLESSARRILGRSERLGFLDRYLGGLVSEPPPRDRVIALVIERSLRGPEARDARL